MFRISCFNENLIVVTFTPDHLTLASLLFFFCFFFCVFLCVFLGGRGGVELFWPGLVVSEVWEIERNTRWSLF